MRKSIILFAMPLSIFLSAALALGEQPAADNAATAEGVEIQWLWGEVVTVDAPNKSLVVRYLDYDTDTEKKITITADEETEFEGVGSMGEIKIQDTVSIDYLVDADKSNKATVISVERMDEISISEEEMIEETEGIKSAPLSSESVIIPPEETAGTTIDSRVNR